MCQELLGYAFYYTHYFMYSSEQPSEGGGGPIRNCFMDEGNLAQRDEITCGTHLAIVQSESRVGTQRKAELWVTSL